MNVRFIAPAFALTLVSCVGSPQQLPVGLSVCNAIAQPNGFAVRAKVENKGEKPISSLGLSLSFYRDFRYTSYAASAHLKQELDPGQKQDVTFDVSGPRNAQSGEALRCIVTHIGYLDGTSADLPPSQ